MPVAEKKEPTQITAENLKAVRKKQKIRQRQVAEWLGISTVAVCKIETGRRNITHSEKIILEWHLLGLTPF